MRLLTVRNEGATRAGRLDDGVVTLLPYSDVGALLADPNWSAAATSAAGYPQIALDEVSFAPLVITPPKIVCVGANYLTHVQEMGVAPRQHPTLFAKYALCLIGARDDLVMPRASTSLDWEAELCVVIGRAGRDVPVERALEHVAGYTVLNDVSARDWQMRTSQFLQGKTFEATTPVGPWLVTPDELPVGCKGLEIKCEVDGTIVQKDQIENMIFDVATIVAYISQIITLQPGDLIATGTTSGVGVSRTPLVFLKPGQTVRTTIESIGELVNLCV